MAELSVSTPFGTFTRTTHRPYRWVVVSCGVLQEVLEARQLAEMRYVQKQLTEYRQVVAGQRPPICDRESYPRFVASLEQQLLDMPEKHQQELETNRRRIAREQGTLVGWSMSEPNARKMAVAASRKGSLNVNIYPVEDVLSADKGTK